MSRESSDELADDGTILNGYDYQLQNWVVNGVLVDVGNAREHWGKKVKDVLGHENRWCQECGGHYGHFTGCSKAEP